MTYEARISGKWQPVSAEKLLFLLLPMGIVEAYRSKDSQVWVKESSAAFSVNARKAENGHASPAKR